MELEWERIVGEVECRLLERKIIIMNSYIVTPEEYELVDFFGVLPNDKNNDGLWNFKVESTNGENLYFSYDIFEKSVQTMLMTNEKIKFCVCFDYAEKIEIITLANGSKRLCVYFCLPNSLKAELKIEQEENFFACFWSLLEI